MPLPKTTDIGRIISFIKKEKPGMKRKQMLAIALKAVQRINRKK